MSVKIVGLDKELGKLDEIRNFLNSPKAMQGVVDDVKGEIQVKTALGKDAQNRSFVPYSKAYAEKKTGMTATGRPNLKRSGTMMNAIEAKVITPKRGEVSVRGAAEPGGKIRADLLAEIHTTGAGRQPERNFMDISDNAFRKIVKAHYDDPILEMARKHRT